MKIIVDRDIPFIHGRLPLDCEVNYLKGTEIDSEKVKDADALIIRTRTKCDERLLKDSNVKLIATATIGTDHIDKKWCEENGVTVKNAPGCNAPGVAQYVFSSLFKTGFDIEKDTLGIVGYGNVGHIVANWAQEMGIKVLINDPPRQAQGWNDVEYLPLEKVLKESEAVTLHVPYTTDDSFPTKYLIGKDQLAQMKNDAMLINSSRGGVVKETDLIEFLSDGKVKVVVDVWENEPEINEVLLDLAEITTPHIAGYSEEGKKRATRMVLENISEFFGCPVDLKGLECEPKKGLKISKDLIEKSYNPEEDSIKLKKDKSCFESLRNNYAYRHEPGFGVSSEELGSRS